MAEAFQLSDQSLFHLLEGEDIITFKQPKAVPAPPEISEVSIPVVKPTKTYPIVVCVAEQLSPDQRLKLDEIILAVKQPPSACLIAQGIKENELQMYKVQATKAFWSFGVEYNATMGESYLIGNSTPYIYAFPPLPIVMENINIKKAVWVKLQQMLMQ